MDTTKRKGKTMFLELSKEAGISEDVLIDYANDVIRIIKSEGLSIEDAMIESLDRRAKFLEFAVDNKEEFAKFMIDFIERAK